MSSASKTTALTALAERVELWPIDRLRPNERNPRTHSDDQVDQIAASMIEFGWTNPILIDENAGILRRVLAGEAHPARDALVLNAAASLALAEGGSLSGAAERARATLASGAALRTLESWCAVSHRAAGVGAPAEHAAVS